MGLARLFRKSSPSGAECPATERAGPKPPEFVPAERQRLESDPLKQLWQQERYAIIVHEASSWQGHPAAIRITSAAREQLDRQLALVPEGMVTLPTSLEDNVGTQEEEVHVQPFLLAVHSMTNALFQRFVDGGGYEDLDLWPEAIWPHLIEMQDLTGQPGPRFWRKGRHDERRAGHPVVGVSWYEADACARWFGMRLPSEAQWQMAASWHLKSEANLLRRFPWGDAMDHTRCNVWGSRIDDTVPVDAYREGAAPNGVLQLIGNVWEWTASQFEVTDGAGRPVLGEMPMRSVRGGAFDTYFESQATSLFRTGQIALARGHHTGFRCAMDLGEYPQTPGE